MADAIFDMKHAGAGFSAGISNITRVAQAAVRQLVAAPVGSAAGGARTMNAQRRPARQQNTASSRAESSALRIVYELPLNDSDVCDFLHELDALRKRMNHEAALSAYRERDSSGETRVGASVAVTRRGADARDRSPAVDDALARAVRLLSKRRSMLG